MGNTEIKIKKHENFRGYKGVKKVGYILDDASPDNTRITNFLVKNKEIRHDNRIQLTLFNGIATVDIIFPSFFFDETFNRFDFENFAANFGGFFFYGTKHDFKLFKEFVYEL
jgi:hypothetical protein